MSALPSQDWLTSSGATALANKIRRYWLAHGYEVEPYVEDMRAQDTGKSNTVYCVRSEMVGGMPRKKAE